MEQSRSVRISEFDPRCADPTPGSVFGLGSAAGGHRIGAPGVLPMVIRFALDQGRVAAQLLEAPAEYRHGHPDGRGKQGGVGPGLEHQLLMGGGGCSIAWMAALSRE